MAQQVLRWRHNFDYMYFRVFGARAISNIAHSPIVFSRSEAHIERIDATSFSFRALSRAFFCSTLSSLVIAFRLVSHSKRDDSSSTPYPNRMVNSASRKGNPHLFFFTLART